MAINILARVEAAMASDTEEPTRQSEYIEGLYTKATPEARQLVDEIFAALCGYKLQTILDGEDDIEGDEGDDEDEGKQVIQTCCAVCDLDVEGFAPFTPAGDWRDRGGNRTGSDGHTHRVAAAEIRRQLEAD